MDRGGEGVWIRSRRVARMTDDVPPGLWIWIFTVDTSSLGLSLICNVSGSAYSE
jgi:hypothetical protein